MTPSPRHPFDADDVTVPIGHVLYRVHSSSRQGNEFNPGSGGPTRFAFFGAPPVPVLYAADTEDAAICETLLHDVPVTGGVVLPGAYRDRVSSKLLIRRPLRLASFLGTGLRRLGVEARDLTGTDSADYAETVKWAEAAHAAGFDGVAYMSRRCNSDRAYSFFGDRVAATDFEIASDFGRAFGFGQDRDWLIEYCAPLGVNVLVI